MCPQSFVLAGFVLSGLCLASGCSGETGAPVPPAAPSAAGAGVVTNAGPPPVPGMMPPSAAEQTAEGTQIPDGTPQPVATQNPDDPSTTEPSTAQAEMEAYVEPTGEEVYPNAEAQLNVSDFLAEFKADSKKFKEHYGNKIIDVTGTLDSYYSSPENVVAHLATESRNNLKFELSQDRPWTICPPGSRVTIRGRVSGLGYMFKAYIVSHEPPEVVELDAEEEAARFSEDESQFVETLKDKVILVRGKLREQIDEEDQSVYELGKADKGVRLLLGRGLSRDPIPWNPPTGKDVAAYGQYSGLSRSGRLTFDEIHPLAPLAEYPPLPKAREQTIDGRSLTVRPFTAELLGRWARENRRALSLAFSSAKTSVKLLASGEIASVENVDLLLGKGVRARLADGHNNDVYFELKEDEAAKHLFKVGDTVSVYGGLQVKDEGVTVSLPTVVEK